MDFRDNRVKIGESGQNFTRDFLDLVLYKSHTLAVRVLWRISGILNLRVKGSSSQESNQKLASFPVPINQWVLSLTIPKLSLILLHKEDLMECLMTLLFLLTIDVKREDQMLLSWKSFQQRWRLDAPLKVFRDFKPRPPSLRYLQQVFQATITIFFLSKIPLHMKFPIQVSMVLVMLAGQL